MRSGSAAIMLLRMKVMCIPPSMSDARLGYASTPGGGANVSSETFCGAPQVAPSLVLRVKKTLMPPGTSSWYARFTSCVL